MRWDLLWDKPQCVEFQRHRGHHCWDSDVQAEESTQRDFLPTEELGPNAEGHTHSTKAKALH